MAKEKWFCFIDVHYRQEDTYIPRHNKIILHIEDFFEALNFLNYYYGDNIEELHMRWAGKDDCECKQELVFSESEFAAFETVKNIIENDNSDADYIKAEEEYERSKQNR